MARTCERPPRASGDIRAAIAERPVFPPCDAWGGRRSRHPILGHSVTRPLRDRLHSRFLRCSTPYSTMPSAESGSQAMSRTRGSRKALSSMLNELYTLDRSLHHFHVAVEESHP
jgi:hypothetical protein